MMTKLDLLLKDGKATKPYLRSVFYVDNTARGGKAGWRASFIQQKPAKASNPNQNSLLRKALAINSWVSYTAIMTVTEKFLKETFQEDWTDENLFFVSQNQNGSAVDSSIVGDYKVVDSLITADMFFGVEENDATTIFVVESFTTNPYRATTMQPVLNPQSGKPVLALAPDGKARPYFRHTELRVQSELFGLQDQSIGDYTSKKNADENALILLPSMITQMMSQPGTFDAIQHLLENPYDLIDLGYDVPVTTSAERSAANKLLTEI